MQAACIFRRPCCLQLCQLFSSALFSSISSYSIASLHIMPRMEEHVSCDELASLDVFNSTTCPSPNAHDLRLYNLLAELINTQQLIGGQIFILQLMSGTDESGSFLHVWDQQSCHNLQSRNAIAGLLQVCTDAMLPDQLWHVMTAAPLSLSHECPSIL